VKTEVSPWRGPLLNVMAGIITAVAVIGLGWRYSPEPPPAPLPIPAPVIIEEVDPPTPLAGPDAPVPVGGIAEFSIPASVVNPRWLIVPEVPYRCYESHDDPHKIVVETSTPGAYRVIVAGIDDESVGSILWHRELTVGPKVIPPEPGPDPPGPTPPPGPVVEGAKRIVVIREAMEPTPELSRTLVLLQSGPVADYFKSKGHTVQIFDDEAKDEQGNPSAYVQAWLKILGDKPLPAVAIEDVTTRNVVHKDKLPASADAVLSIVKGVGG
jgi:hypothetical protein